MENEEAEALSSNPTLDLDPALQKKHRSMLEWLNNYHQTHTDSSLTRRSAESDSASSPSFDSASSPSFDSASSPSFLPSYEIRFSLKAILDLSYYPKRNSLSKTKAPKKTQSASPKRKSQRNRVSEFLIG
ncbi:hypothetical protein M0R45_025868 [Rubus argutus]|uniref:Uncharacterized protein n=1 Tax=Rubus argutus TaxID=59490 RepID=A0AAW1WVT5_RUBAR